MEALKRSNHTVAFALDLCINEAFISSFILSNLKTIPTTLMGELNIHNLHLGSPCYCCIITHMWVMIVSERLRRQMCSQHGHVRGIGLGQVDVGIFVVSAFFKQDRGHLWPLHIVLMAICESLCLCPVLMPRQPSCTLLCSTPGYGTPPPPGSFHSFPPVPADVWDVKCAWGVLYLESGIWFAQVVGAV